MDSMDTELILVHNEQEMSTVSKTQGGWNMTGTNCDLFTHKSSRS